MRYACLGIRGQRIREASTNDPIEVAAFGGCPQQGRVHHHRESCLMQDERSKERRGGKEGRSRGSPYHLKKKKEGYYSLCHGGRWLCRPSLFVLRCIRVAKARMARNSATCLGIFFQAEDGIRDYKVTGVQTCALPI